MNQPPTQKNSRYIRRFEKLPPKMERAGALGPNGRLGELTQICSDCGKCPLQNGRKIQVKLPMLNLWGIFAWIFCFQENFFGLYHGNWPFFTTRICFISPNFCKSKFEEQIWEPSQFLASPETKPLKAMMAGRWFFSLWDGLFPLLCYVNFRGVLQNIYDTVPHGLHGSFTKTKLLPAIEKSSFGR